MLKMAPFSFNLNESIWVDGTDLLCLDDGSSLLAIWYSSDVIYYQVVFKIIMFRQFLIQISGKPVKEVTHFVIGNSSVDYDTFFGSILLAYLLTFTTKNTYLPIIDCKAHQISYRFDIAQVLRLLKINSSSFLYQSAIKEVQPGSYFNLYDHNLRPEISPQIEYIIDHHEIKSTNAKKYLITRMGSALTHLYYLMNPEKIAQIPISNEEEQTYKNKFAEFIKGEPFEHLHPEKQQLIQQIIRYGILMDTFNFDPQQKQRWTIFDKTAVQLIQKNHNYSIGYEYLSDLKFDQKLNKDLPFQAALNKDYKRAIYKDISIEYSIIYLQPIVFIQHYGSDIQQWLSNSLNSDFYLLMSIFRDDKGILQRQLLVRVREQSQKYLKMMNYFLETLKLQPIFESKDWYIWRDPKATISRKKFDKLFQHYLEQKL